MPYRQKFLVTGGAGFIGSHIARELVRKGCDVTCIDSLIGSESWSRVDDIADQIQIVTADLIEFDVASRVLSEIDVVFHTAGIREPTNSYDRLARAIHPNIVGDILLLEAAMQCDVQKVILSSSCDIYGTGLDSHVTESNPINPASIDGLSKQLTECIATFCSSHCNLNVISLRYTDVYGETQTADPWTAPVAALAQAHAEGTVPLLTIDADEPRDFVHVDDIVRANLLAMQSTLPSGSVLNIGSGFASTIRQLLQLTSSPEPRSTRFRMTRRSRHRSAIPSIAEATRLLGYTPEVALADGFARTLRWFQAGM